MGVIHSGGSCVSLCNPLTKFLEQCIKEKGLVGVEGRGDQSFSLYAVRSQILSQWTLRKLNASVGHIKGTGFSSVLPVMGEGGAVGMMVLLDCHVQKDERFQSTFLFLAYLNESEDCSRLPSWCRVMAEVTGAVSLLLRPAVALIRREGVSCGVSWDLMTWILRERGNSGKTLVLDTAILKNFVTFEVIDGWFCCLFCKKFHILDV